MNEQIDLLPAPALIPSADPIALLLADKRSEVTQKGYRSDLRRFFDPDERTDRDPAPDEVRAFLSLEARDVALRLAQYKAAMLTRGLAEATINRRLAAVRSLLRYAYRVGLSTTDGRGLVDSEKTQAYRDTRGPGLAVLQRLVSTPEIDTVRGLRDRAILRLLAENALRRAEVCRADVGDFVLSENRLMILGKGKGSQKQPITLSAKCCAALTSYLEAAGHAGQPDQALFLSCDPRPAFRARRLTVDGLYAIVQKYGAQVGANLSVHKMRHGSITAALDASSGDVRSVQKLSRHKNIATVLVYDDNRTDQQGRMTRLLSELL